jgi:hypothetical protein
MKPPQGSIPKENFKALICPTPGALAGVPELRFFEPNCVWPFNLRRFNSGKLPAGLPE